ncbi:tenascin X [Tieghemostelium lacteum]|uniref:Tenascin X n=1 Tax=Tieghemostelium lacteum TaxID=361077 RepID=A0A152A5A1_TIELA|nr:tenascin X [Tieghemostelium lacteum]|eukprot:KYR01277.1 tenascin X [Tieghemostelium lacteum]
MKDLVLIRLLILTVFISTIYSFPTSISQLNSTNSVAIRSPYSGYVEGECDINGDGNQDIIVITRNGYVVLFGNVTRYSKKTRPIELDVNGINGFKFEFLQPERYPICGDFNNDGYDDIVLTNSLPAAGRIYVIYGSSGPFNATMVIDGNNGFIIEGEPHQALGITKAICDVNGDGVKDFVFGSKTSFYDGVEMSQISHKKSYVLFGLKNGEKYPTDSKGEFNKTSIEDGNIGFYMDTQSLMLYCGDINNDGYDDILFLNPTCQIMFGRPSFPAFYSPSYNGSDGFLISNVSNSIQRYRLASFGDFNGDGLTDMAVSNANQSALEVYVIFGQRSGYKWHSTFNPTIRDDSKVVAFVKGSGTYVSHECDSVILSDVNGDGLDDLQCVSVSDRLVWAVYGTTIPLAPVVRLSDRSSPLDNQCTGFRFREVDGLEIASSDFNNDGIQDMLVAKGDIIYGVYGERNRVVANLQLKSTSIPFNQSGIYHFLQNNYQPLTTSKCQVQSLRIRLENLPEKGDSLEFIPPISSRIKVTRASSTDITLHNMDHSIDFLNHLSSISFTTRRTKSIATISLYSRGTINSTIDIHSYYKTPCICHSNSTCVGNYQCIPKGVPYQNQDCRTYGCSFGFECNNTKCQFKSECYSCDDLTCEGNEKCAMLVSYGSRCQLFPFCVTI